MSTDYSKRKNAELEDLLKARSLPHTGKKADLVARLQQYDKEQSTSTTTSTPAAAAPTTEDEIDWEDDTVAAPPTTTATSRPSAAALSAGGTGPIDTPVAVPNQVPAEDPSTATDLTVQPPTSNDIPATEAKDTTAAVAPPPDFSASLSSTSLTAELAKRAARAARFGLADASTKNNDEATKALERAKRFGIQGGEGAAVKGLDTALPERGPRKRGRGGEDEEGANRGGKRGRGGREGRERRDGGRERRNGAERRNVNAGGGGLSEKDRVAAEARKKRFAAAA